jgi:hypothetical protein
MSAIKIVKGEATTAERAAIEKALSKRQSELPKSSNYGKVENNS